MERLTSLKVRTAYIRKNPEYKPCFRLEVDIREPDQCPLPLVSPQEREEVNQSDRRASSPAAGSVFGALGLVGKKDLNLEMSPESRDKP